MWCSRSQTMVCCCTTLLLSIELLFLRALIFLCLWPCKKPTITLMSNKLERAREILEMESRAIQNIPLNNTLLQAVELIAATRGKVVCSGMGKAGIIARKVAATFSSTGTAAVFSAPGRGAAWRFGYAEHGRCAAGFFQLGQNPRGRGAGAIGA